MLGGRALEEEKRYQQVLLRQRAESEQHRLNYEKLKAITIRYQLNNSKATEEGEKEGKDKEELLLGTSPNKKAMDMNSSSTKSGLSHESQVALNSSPVGKSTRRIGVRRIPVKYSGPDESQKKLNLSSVAVTRAQLCNSPVQQIKFDCLRCGQYEEDKHALMNTCLNEVRSIQGMLEAQVQTTMSVEKENKELQNSQLILARSNSTLKLENQTLREELEETRKKLEETTSINAILQKDIETTRSQLASQEQQIKQRTLTKDIGTLAIESELKSLRLKNQRLEESKLLMTESHEEEKREMKALLVCVYNKCLDEKNALQTKYIEIKDLLATQQYYAEEISHYSKAGYLGSQGIVEEMVKELSNVVIEGKSALEVIESKLRKTVSEKAQLQTDLENAVVLLEKAKVDVGRRQERTKGFIESLLVALELPPTLDFKSPELVCKKTEHFDDSKCTPNRNEELSYHEILVKFLNWKATQRLKIMELEKRNATLNTLLVSERTKIAQMNAKTSNPVAHKVKGKKRLAITYRPGKVIYPPDKVVETKTKSNEESVEQKQQERIEFSQEHTVSRLLEHHINFGKILNDVTPSD